MRTYSRHAALTGLATLAGLFAVVACSSETDEGALTPGSEPDAAIEFARLDAEHLLAPPITYGALSMWPIVADGELAELGGMRLLHEAQAAGDATVSERGGDAAETLAQLDDVVNRSGVGEPAGGSAAPAAGEFFNNDAQATVNRLVIANNGDEPLLVCAGTVVKGGKQDRQIGEDVIIAAGESIEVEAFCVEAGRWTNVRGDGETDGQFVALAAFTSEGARKGAQYGKDQQEVWAEVADFRARTENVFDRNLSGASALAQDLDIADFDVEIAQLSDLRTHRSMPGEEVNLDPTGEFISETSFVDCLESTSPAQQLMQEEVVTAVRAHVAALTDAGHHVVGLGYAIGQEPVGARVFAHPRLFDQSLRPLATTFAVEAMLADTDLADCATESLIALIHSIESESESEQITATAGRNANGLKESAAGFNGNCYMDLNGRQIAVTRDWTRR